MRKLLPLTFMTFALQVPAQVDLVSDLQLCIPFANNDARDISGNNFHGSVNGANASIDRFGNPANAFTVGKNSNGISISAFSSAAPSNELSISIWGRSDILGTTCLFMLNPDSETDRCMGCAQFQNAGQNTSIYWDYGNVNSGGRTAVSNLTYSFNWHHYVFIVSQSGNKKQVYMDGVLKADESYGSSLINRNKSLIIGGTLANGSSPNYRWNGAIDDLCIYSRALNAAEVSELFAGKTACFTVGLEERGVPRSLRVYPSMSETGVFYIPGNASADSRYEIYNVDGRLIRQHASESDVVDLSEHASGMYIVQITGNGKFHTQKIIRL